MAKRLRETEAAIQAEFHLRFEAELQVTESRRKEEEEQRKKEEEDKRAEKAKGKESKGSKGGKGSSNARSPSSMANLQKREAMKIGSAADTREEPGRDPDLAEDAGRTHHAGSGPMSGTYIFQPNPTLLISMCVHPTLLFHIQVV